jgi:hypothetical protein
MEQQNPLRADRGNACWRNHTVLQSIRHHPRFFNSSTAFSRRPARNCEFLMNSKNDAPNRRPGDTAMTADKRRGRRCVFNQQLWSLLCPGTKACPWLVADDGYSEFHKEAKRLKEAVQFRALFNLGATRRPLTDLRDLQSVGTNWSPRGWHRATFRTNAPTRWRPQIPTDVGGHGGISRHRETGTAEERLEGGGYRRPREVPQKTASRCDPA